MNNAQELKAHLQDSNKARMYEAKKKQDKHNLLVDKMYEKVEQQINKKATMKDKKKKKIEDDIWEIENQYPYLHFDRDRHKFNKADVNELNKLYSKLRKIKEGQ